MQTPTSQARRRRRVRIGAALALVVAALGLTVLAVPRPVPVAAGTSEVASQDLATEGREVYRRDCASCHGPEGEGSQRGPTLQESGGAAVDFYLRTGRMPLEEPRERVQAGPPSYDDATIDALVTYVSLLATGGQPIPAVAPGDPVQGRTLFLTSCAPCHSSSGTGMILSGGTWAPELYDTPATQVAEAVRIGPGPMPKFHESHLSKEEVDDIVTYVLQLGEEQVQSGHGLDQYGPIAEGAFLWFALVPVLLVVTLVLGKRAKR